MSFNESLNTNKDVPLKTPSIVKIQCSGGKILTVDYNVAKMFQTIKTLVEDTEIKDDSPIKLNNISEEVMSKMIEFAKYHVNDPPFPEDEISREKRRTSDITGFDLDFIESLNQELLFEVISAANFLYIRGLIDLTCKAVANYLKNKSVEEIRKTFNIKNDFTPSEEEQIKIENAWAE